MGVGVADSRSRSEHEAAAWLLGRAASRGPGDGGSIRARRSGRIPDHLAVFAAKVKKRGVIQDRHIDDDPRCRDCDGACCRSFPSVELSWTEYETLRALGATRLVFSLRGHHFLVIENGCEFLVDGRCSIYERRPEICRRFICEA